MMAAFLQHEQPDADSELKTTSIQAFEFSVQNFVERFTNYGCYCWILGPDKGVIGGGQTRDQIDGLCGQLYKCYKCLNIDHGTDSGLFDYEVLLNANDDGTKELTCQDGPNKDACLCDKAFADRLASITAQCNTDIANGVENSPFCINEDFRTQNGGGSFDPFDESEGKRYNHFIFH